jgi:hypothetical protein
MELQIWEPAFNKLKALSQYFHIYFTKDPFAETLTKRDSWPLFNFSGIVHIIVRITNIKLWNHKSCIKKQPAESKLSFMS